MLHTHTISQSVQGSRQECHSYYKSCCLCLWDNSSHPINLLSEGTHPRAHSHTPHIKNISFEKEATLRSPIPFRIISCRNLCCRILDNYIFPSLSVSVLSPSIITLTRTLRRVLRQLYQQILFLCAQNNTKRCLMHWKNRVRQLWFDPLTIFRQFRFFLLSSNNF